MVITNDNEEGEDMKDGHTRFSMFSDNFISFRLFYALYIIS